MPTNRKPHVLFAVSWYKDEHSPQLGSFFEEQARAVQSIADCSIVVLEFASYKSPLKAHFYKEEDRGLTTWRFRYKNKMPLAPSAALSRFKKACSKVLTQYEEESGRPDIIHVQSCFYAGIGIQKYAIEQSVPTVLTEHFTGFVEQRALPKVDVNAARSAFVKADKVIAVSNVLGKALRKTLDLGNLPIAVVPNMVDQRFFSLSLDSRENEGFVFFSAGHLTERKNYRALIEALNLLSKESRVIIRIAGGGEQAQDLKNLVSTLGIGDRVLFLGILSRDEIAKELSLANAYIQTSRIETFGVAMAEALAAGKPVISTRSGGPEGFINETNGILCGHETTEIAEAMSSLVRTYADYDPELIRKNCHREFSAQALVSKLGTIYSEVLKR